MQATARKIQSDKEPIGFLGTQSPFPRKLSPVSDERVIDICECVMDIVAAVFNVSGKELRRPGRSSTEVARVRQMGMYVAHVVLRLSMNDIGRGFGRDRTTVLHACHTIEDLRDDEDFDRIIHMTEQVTAAAFRHMEVLR
ncbi:helix-turn-helix domain-containing protein [Chelativorans sp.]|uniref:helix-turn-helix domain-containing protein n=1 Tax=Chelativorans sp. TaxID=2203393 RepID=UPI0035C70C77